MEIANQLAATNLNESSESIVGSIRINPKCFTDAFIHDPDGGPDIYIEGAGARNVALEGDTVRVQLNPKSKWKLNRNIITTRWDEWSKYLSPIIDDIEAAENAQRLKVEAVAKKKILKDQDVKRSSRHKRSVSETTQDSAEQRAKMLSSKIPANLPSGISKLQVEHVLILPFSSSCIQKTGYVVEIIERTHSGLAGGFLKKFSQHQALFSPLDSRIPRILIDLIQCPQDFSTQADRYTNILFVARLESWDQNQNFAIGSLIKIVGDSNMIESRIEALLIEHQIDDSEFPPDAYQELQYLEDLPKNWFKENSKGRRDLTAECVFTIDPKTARDLDDAVSIKRIAEQVYEVGVHIADVSHFVKEMSAVDYYARLRTTSVYLVDRVIPMLPRPLCEHMCSLNPGESKLTFSVIWKMNKYGHIIDEWFGKTIINSCVKLSYEHAQDIIDNQNDLSWIREEINMPKLFAFNWNQISKSVLLLNKIAQNMRAKRFEGGALRIDQVKLKYELDPESGFPTGFTFENRTDSNFLIEEFMLQANMSVAKRIYLAFKDRAFLRRHPASDPQLLKDVKDFCDAKGCPLDITSAGSIQRSLNSIADPTTSKVVSFLLLRAMKNAEYFCTGALPPETNGYQHFALNVPFYTHFTSPIRRYADIIVHRQLDMALTNENDSNEDVNTLTLMASECTKRKISSKLISEASQKLYFNLFVQKAGFCELLACVTRIYDQSFDVILVDYNQTGRVYLDRVKAKLNSYKFESFSGVKRLVLNWKPAPSPALLKKSSRKTRRMKKAKSISNGEQAVDEEQLNRRLSLQARKSLGKDSDLKINESASDKQQVIEVFDVIRVIVTVEEKDISKLKIDLKTPVCE